MAERFLIEATGPDMDALEAGFAWLRHAVAQGQHPEGVVLVQAKQQLDHLSPYIPEAHIVRLGKGESVNFIDIRLRAMLLSKGQPSRVDVPLLALWVDSGQLQAIETTLAPAICALTWIPGDAAVWKENHGPTDPRTGTQYQRPPLAISAVVQVALSYLPEPRAGLVHPNDKAKVVDLFRVLTRAGEAYIPEAVRIWAVQHGWTDRDAELIEDIATRIRSGRTIKGQAWWPANTIEDWRRLARDLQG